MYIEPCTIFKIAPAILATVASAACSSVDVSPLPADTTTEITALLTNAQNSVRASAALQWGDKVNQGRLSKAPADVSIFTESVCTNPFDAAVLAAKSLNAYNDEVTRLAKAPDASFTGYIGSIHDHQAAIKAAQAKGKPDPKKIAEEQRKLHDQCVMAVSRDLALAPPGATFAPKSVLGALAAFQALMAIPQKILQIVEAKKRADAVRAYVIASEDATNKALETLGKDGWLDKAIQETRTYFVRRAYVAYSDAQAEVKSNSASSAAARSADEYAMLTAEYLRLQHKSGTKIIDDPEEGLAVAYAKFAEAAKNPNADPLRAFDAFLASLQNIADLNKAIGDFKKAREDMSGS